MNRSENVLESQALLLKRVEFGESDLVLTFFTERFGRVSALARGARRSRKRFGGALEPFFTLNLRLLPPGRGELFTLLEANIARARVRLLSDLDRMNAAGRALNWLRRTAPVQTQEPLLWALMEGLLDRLSEGGPDQVVQAELARMGLGLLSALGFGLELGRCVRCGRECPTHKAASLDLQSGGLICRACGSARKRLSASVRAELVAATQLPSSELRLDTALLALELIDAVLQHHAGIEP